MHTANDKNKIKNQTNELTFFQQLLNNILHQYIKHRYIEYIMEGTETK